MSLWANFYIFGGWAKMAKVNLVRGLSERVPLVRAIGRVVHRGRQVTTAEAELVGHDGKLYAHASTTCLVFDLPA